MSMQILRPARLSANAILLFVVSFIANGFGLLPTSAPSAVQDVPAKQHKDDQQGSRLLYQSTLASAEKALRLHEVRDARKWLDHSPADLRGWEWQFLSGQCDESKSGISLGERVVTALDVSSDGSLLAISTSTGEVTIYQLPDFVEVSKIGDHRDAVYSVCFSDDATRLVTVSRDATSRVWNVASGREISRIQLDNPGVAAACFSPAGNDVATCTWMMVEENGGRSVRGVVWIWDAETGEVKFKKHVGVKPLDSIQWAADGSKIVAGSWDGLIHVLDNQANELKTLTVPDDGIYTAVISVAISPDGQLVAAGSKDRTARVWRMDEGTLQTTMTGHDGYVNDVKFTSDGNRLVTASVDGTNRIWDTKSGKQLEVMHGHTGNVTAMDLAGDDRKVISAGCDQRLRAWDLSSNFGGRLSVRVKPEGTYSTVYSPDGNRIYIACYDGHVRELDSSSGQIINDWVAHEDSSCNTLSLSHDGERLLTCSWDKSARLWNPIDQSLLMTLDVGEGVTHCAISPDGKRAALAVGKNLQIWDLETGKQIGTGKGHQANLIDLVWSGDGKFIATSAHSEPARIWNGQTGELVAELGDRPATTVMFSHDGKWIATGESGKVSLWNTNGFELVRTISVSDSSVNRMAFSPDDSRLAAGAEAIYLLDPAAGESLIRFQPNDDTIYYLAFSPDGSRLTSCTTGGSIAINGD